MSTPSTARAPLRHPPARKYGHNEIDEPMFTQPLMYKKIRAHKNPHQLYVDKLLASGDIDAATVRPRARPRRGWLDGGRKPAAVHASGRPRGLPSMHTFRRPCARRPAQPSPSQTFCHPPTRHPPTHPSGRQVRAVHDNIQAKLNAAFEGAKDYQPQARRGCPPRAHPPAATD